MSVFDFVIRFKTDGVDQMVNSVKGKLHHTMRDIGTGMAAYMSVDALKEQVRATSEYALRMKDLSEQFDISTDKLQEMEFAAGMSGIGIEEIIPYYNRLKLAREAALAGKRGNPNEMDFATLGISSAKLRSMSPEETWDTATKAIAKMSYAANTARLSVELFGRSGIKFTNVLKGGFIEAADSVKTLGIVISRELIEKVDLAEKSFSMLKMRLRNITGTFINEGMSFVEDQFAGMAGVKAFFTKPKPDAVTEDNASPFDRYFIGRQTDENTQFNAVFEAHLAELLRSRHNKKQDDLTPTSSKVSGAAQNPSDALTRIGLFRGGGGPSPTVLLQTQINRMDRMVTQLSTLNTNLTSDP